MRLCNGCFSIEISDINGCIKSLTNGIKEFVAAELPLAEMAFREKDGSEKILNTDMALFCRINNSENRIELEYEFEGGTGLYVLIEAGEELKWYCKVINKSSSSVEWIRCPQICLPLDLIGNGGKSRLLWGFNEGAVIEDIDYRNPDFGYREPKYPGEGLMPVFPAIVQMQCMAHYDMDNGLYIGTHDREGNVKSFDFRRNGNGVEFDIRSFAGADFGEDYNREYPVVMKMFSGDWQSAAEIYRSWFEENKAENFVKILENSRLPEWYRESPVVITYPVRGRHDMDVMNPNKMFPYINAMEHIERLSKELDSKIMVLLMHWEGTAPWAPPFVWPPYGGEACLKEFIDKLHEDGHLLGVYCSGIGWTEKSNVVDDYCKKDDYDRLGLESEMCVSPEGVVEKSHICRGQRSGYDFCPTSDVLCEILERELTAMVDSGIDYVQILDQNHGGTSYFCYGREHGHPPVPGRWQTEAMRKLLSKLNRITEERKVLLGCESAAAETYIPELLFSDNRYNLCYNIGKPVPLYGYLYHEYINNFSGNQVSTNWFIDYDKSPDNLCMRIAQSFIAGDMLTLVLNDEGKIMQSWGCRDFDNLPNQDDVIKLVKNLNYWRRKYPQYLLSGRMIPGYKIETSSHPLYHKRDYVDEHNDVYSSSWTDGSNTACFLVNYTGCEAECRVEFGTKLEYSLVTADKVTSGEEEDLTIIIPPRCAVMIETKNIQGVEKV